ncbi:MAG TPA: hypothetical protein VFQ45_15130, partial [Longimicrobium sp.]|nr:hypothetical protein [Longimicrobium sp.]
MRIATPVRLRLPLACALLAALASCDLLLMHSDGQRQVEIVPAGWPSTVSAGDSVILRVVVRTEDSLEVAAPTLSWSTPSPDGALLYPAGAETQRLVYFRRAGPVAVRVVLSGTAAYSPATFEDTIH